MACMVAILTLAGCVYVLFLASLNYATGGNAELSPTSSVFTVVRPNTAGHAHAVLIATEIGTVILPIGTGVLSGRWSYRRSSR
jgi:hypothetical protein